MRKLNVLIAGSTGYIGIQLIKLLIKHKYINIKYLCGSSSVGKDISSYDKSIKRNKLPKIKKFHKKLLNKIDIVFTALPNGQAQIISKLLGKNTTLIDLSADFRLEKSNEYFKYYKIKHKAKSNINKSKYSIPEFSYNKLNNTKIIACPGCYPTSILLPLIPLLQRKLIINKNIIIDSKSGYSGAGRGVHKKYKHKNLYESISAYGLFNHRHNSELKQELNKSSKNPVDFIFTPHLSPMFRGILSTIYLELNKNVKVNQITKYLKEFYKNKRFVKIAKKNSLISTNDIINTNICKISVQEGSRSNKIIILSAIDNLIKGGAGQAVQNMNLKFNFPKNHGL